MDETLPGPEPPRRRSHLYAPHAARSPRCDRPAASIPARHPSSCLCGSGRPDSSTFIVPLTHRQLGQALLMGLSRQCPESLGLSARFLEESSAVPLQPAPAACPPRVALKTFSPLTRHTVRQARTSRAFLGADDSKTQGP